MRSGVMTGAALVLPLVLACGSGAAALEIELSSDAGPAERIEARYDCSDGMTRSVTYLNRDPVFLAVVPATADETLVFANVVSASGSRYVAGAWQWWSKGDEASLSDVRAGEDAAPVTCTAQDG